MEGPLRKPKVGSTEKTHHRDTEDTETFKNTLENSPWSLCLSGYFSRPKIGLYNLTTTTKTGGVETFVWELGQELQRRGFEVHLIGGRSPRPDRYPGLTVLRYPFVDRALFRRLPGLGRAWAVTKLLERLSFAATTLSLLLRQRYDILHIQKPYDLPVALLVRALVGSKVVFGCHGEDFWPGDRLS